MRRTAHAKKISNQTEFFAACVCTTKLVSTYSLEIIVDTLNMRFTVHCSYSLGILDAHCIARNKQQQTGMRIFCHSRSECGCVDGSQRRKREFFDEQHSSNPFYCQSYSFVRLFVCLFICVFCLQIFFSSSVTFVVRCLRLVNVLIVVTMQNIVISTGFLIIIL